MSVPLSVTNRSIATGSCLPCRMTLLLLSMVLPSYPPPHLHSHFSHIPSFQHENCTFPHSDPEHPHIWRHHQRETPISTREGLNIFYTLLYTIPSCAQNSPLIFFVKAVFISEAASLAHLGWFEPTLPTEWDRNIWKWAENMCPDRREKTAVNAFDHPPFWFFSSSAQI